VPGGDGGATYAATWPASPAAIDARVAGARASTRPRNCRAMSARSSGTRERSAVAAQPASGGGIHTIVDVAVALTGTRSRMTTVPANWSPTRLPFALSSELMQATDPKVSQMSMKKAHSARTNA
jgi:hypothetical protein